MEQQHPRVDSSLLPPPGLLRPLSPANQSHGSILRLQPPGQQMGVLMLALG